MTPATTEAPRLTLRDRLRGWLAHDTHPGIQFVKYALAGGIATGVDLGITFLLSWLVFPALKPEEMLVRLLGIQVVALDAATRSMHFALNKGIAFLFSNATAYALNVLFVFKPGKHSRRKELVLFYLVSGLAWLVGTALGAAAMSWLNLSFAVTIAAAVGSSLLLNYAGRKFFIFNG